MLFTTQRVELINKKTFAVATLDKNTETFMVYVATLSASEIKVHSSCKIQFRLLLADKALIKILSKYLDYTNIFLFDLLMELLKNTNINKYIIKLVKDKKPSCRPIYNLELLE